MEITIDFETRSVVDLKKHGLFVYAEHPTTDAICLGVQVEDEEPRIWINPYFRKIVYDAGIAPYPEISTAELSELVKQADVIVAQNSMFEYVIWNEVCTKKHGFPHLPLEKLHDTQAQLAYHALPQNLEKGAKALRLAVQKDLKGHQAMLKLCKPKCLEPLIWNEDPRFLNDEILYCMDDCRAERLIYKTLPKLPPKEREIWLLDQQINLRGIHVDVESAKLWAGAVETDKAELLAEFKTLCRNEVSGPRSYVKLKEWVNKECELDLDSIGKEATKELMENEGIPAHVKRILEIKTEAGKASAAKLTAMLSKKSKDNRVRGCFQYHGASTGRWAARGIQPQNMPRDSYGPLDYETAKQAYLCHGKEGLGLFYDLPSFVASRMVRGTLTAGPGKVFICSDFSSIESMTLNHQAGEEWVVEAFRRGECAYRHNAAKALSLSRGVLVRYEDIDPKGKERQAGKTGELACGYQGAAGAVRRFDKMPGVSDEDIMKTIVQPWRDTHPNVVAFWRGLEDAAKEAVREPGKVFSYRGADFASNKAFLKMRLPSGRCLHYFNPGVEQRFIPKTGRPEDHPTDCQCDECGWFGDNISFYGMKMVDGKTTTAWGKIFTYGGKLTNNCISGDAEVFTSKGWVKISEYKEGLPVWDGEEFVIGGKLLDRGIQGVILFKGVEITPDHKVLCKDNQWRTVNEVAPQRQGFNGKSFCVFVHRVFARLKKRASCLERSLRMREAYTGSREGFDTDKRSESPVLRLQVQGRGGRKGADPRTYKSSGIPCLESYARTMHVSAPSGLEELWRERHTGIKRMARKLRDFLGGYGTDLRDRTLPGSYRRKRELRKDELPLGKYAGERKQQEKQPEDKHTRRVDEYSASGSKVWSRCYDHTLPIIKRLAGRAITGPSRPVKNCRVFDIANCGPRHRFVVRAPGGGEPFIAHNCIQGLCRDIMADAMLRLEKENFPVSFHTHDEIICEIPEKDVKNDTLKVFEQIMSEVPAYVKGLPLIAKGGWSGKRYRK